MPEIKTVKRILNYLMIGIFTFAAIARWPTVSIADPLTKPFTGVCEGTVRSSGTTIDARVSVTLDALKGDRNGHRNLGSYLCIVTDWDLALFCPDPKHVCRVIGVIHFDPKTDHFVMTKTLDVIELGEGEVQ